MRDIKQIILPPARTTCRVIGIHIDALSWGEAEARLMGWGEARQGRVVCICNVHSVVTARRDPAYAKSLTASDMNTADGAPVAWFMRRRGFPSQERINGPDLMWRCCAIAEREGQSIYLYGGSSSTLEVLQERLRAAFPALRIAGAHSPPFRALTDEEDEADVARINQSGANIVWVGLGCPKQEAWMVAHRGRINAPLVGVGAAFDYHAGTVRRAPRWMQKNGLEWLHRLLSEPRRLFKRYAVTNTLFIKYVMADSISRRFTEPFSPPFRP